MSFGGTKNGCWAAEAIVVFEPAAYPHLAHLRQRAGHGLSKQRFIAAQFEGYFADGGWLETAAHANAMAARLQAGLRTQRFGPARVAVDRQRALPGLSTATAAALRAGGAAFHTWEGRGDDELVRLVTSFATTPDDVDRFLALLPAP